MRDKIKSIIGNGLPWGLALFCLGLLLGRFTFSAPLRETLYMSGIAGVCAILANGLMHSRFAKRLKHLEKISTEFRPTESLLLQAPANHLIDDGSVAGKLFLTNKRLIFKPLDPDQIGYQSFSWDAIQLEWDLTKVSPSRFYSSLWNAGGNFLLLTKDGVSLAFEVNEIKPWKKALQK